MRWSKGDLEELIDERVRYVSKRNDSGLASVDDLLPHTNSTRGCAFDYILERTLMRPRDTISFINECLSLSSGQGRLTWGDITRAEKSYSEKRLLALRDEKMGADVPRYSGGVGSFP